MNINDSTLTNLPILSKRVKTLVLLNTKISILDNITDSIIKLYCYHNAFSSITVPNKVIHLYLNYNLNLTKIIFESNKLHLIDCSNNSLEELDNIPNSTTHINCDNNKISKISQLPDNLIVLFCNNNQLTELPIIPPNVYSLRCQNNFLKEIKLTNPLKELHCDANIQNLEEIIPLVENLYLY